MKEEKDEDDGVGDNIKGEVDASNIANKEEDENEEKTHTHILIIGTD